MTPWRVPLHSLGAKLLALSLVLVVLPGGVFAWVALRATRSALETAVGRQLTEVAHDASSRVDLEIDRLQGEMGEWARGVVASATGDLGGASDLAPSLATLLAGEPVIEALAYVDGRGREVTAKRPVPRPETVGAGLRGSSIAPRIDQRPWWRDASAGRSVVSVRWESADAAILELAVPVPGVPGGVLAADVSVESLAFLLQHLQHDLANQGLETELLLVGGDGRVLVSGAWREPSRLLGRDLLGDGWSVVVSRGSRARPYSRRDDRIGALVGVAAVSMPALGWQALAVQSQDEAFAQVRELRNVLTFALVAILAAGTLLAALLAARLARPIRELTEATRELARTGETRRPVAVRSRDEIGELAGAFNSMAEDLRRERESVVAAAKLAFVGELAAGMAHEIRTPLGIVKSSAQILGRAAAAGDERSRELVGMIVEEVDRLDRVVAGLLELARPQPPVLEDVPLAAPLRRAADLLAGQADERGIKIVRSLEGPTPAARCDPDQVYQICLNLILNALQILAPGGVIELRTFAAGASVGFEVRDDGPGMPAEVREHLFTPFFTRRPGGTGLGLALVQRLVQAHHGSISVETAPGRGACFRVTLPAADGEVEPVEAQR